VLEDETFAGEGLTDSIKPGEKRLVSYAIDLGMRVNSKAEGDPQRVTRCRIARGVMIQTSILRQQTIYTIRNDDTTPRILVIEHPTQAGWKISEDPKPEESTASTDRFRVTLEPKATETLKFHESKSLETRYELSNITDNQIGIFLQQKSINPEVEAALRKILAQKDRVAGFESELTRRDEEKQKIYDDQQRICENLKALKGSAEERALTQRYTQQLSDQENRLQGIEKEVADLQGKHDQAQAELDQMVESLSFALTL
jgi:hypothetical protein